MDGRLLRAQLRDPVVQVDSAAGDDRQARQLSQRRGMVELRRLVRAALRVGPMHAIRLEDLRAGAQGHRLARDEEATGGAGHCDSRWA